MILHGLSAPFISSLFANYMQKEIGRSAKLNDLASRMTGMMGG
jgi:hypothetical protein